MTEVPTPRKFIPLTASSLDHFIEVMRANVEQEPGRVSSGEAYEEDCIIFMFRCPAKFTAAAIARQNQPTMTEAAP